MESFFSTGDSSSPWTFMNASLAGEESRRRRIEKECGRWAFRGYVRQGQREMGEEGLEPSHLAVADPKSGASTSFATRPALLRDLLLRNDPGVQPPTRGALRRREPEKTSGPLHS